MAGTFAALHTLGRPWTPVSDPAAQSVVSTMRAVSFLAAGQRRSYFDFYEGFGLTLSAFLALEAVLLWQLAALARAGAHFKPLALTHLVGFLVVGTIAARFIFALPLYFSLVIAACIGLALWPAHLRRPTAG